MCSLIDILQWKKDQKDSDDFWHRKLTSKVKFWYFLTAPHYSNFQNLVISFEYSWFLTKSVKLILQVMSAEVSLKGLVKVPCIELTEDCGNNALKTNGL